MFQKLKKFFLRDSSTPVSSPTIQETQVEQASIPEGTVPGLLTEELRETKEREQQKWRMRLLRQRQVLEKDKAAALLKLQEEHNKDYNSWQKRLQVLEHSNSIDSFTPDQKQCSECFCFIDNRARRCPYCTTILIA